MVDKTELDERLDKITREFMEKCCEGNSLVSE